MASATDARVADAAATVIASTQAGAQWSPCVIDSLAQLVALARTTRSSSPPPDGQPDGQTPAGDSDGALLAEVCAFDASPATADKLARSLAKLLAIPTPPGAMGRPDRPLLNTLRLSAFLVRFYARSLSPATQEVLVAAVARAGCSATRYGDRVRCSGAGCCAAGVLVCHAGRLCGWVCGSHHAAGAGLVFASKWWLCAYGSSLPSACQALQHSRPSRRCTTCYSLPSPWLTPAVAQAVRCGVPL